jgi:hypothetical protein
MIKDFSTRVAGGAFVAAAGMLWGGWMLMPTHIGTFFDTTDFAAVHAHLWLWIWMFRLHLFGMVTAVLALVALGSLVNHSESRILVWPGVAVASGGLLVGAVAAAFYYHFGAWGAMDMAGKSEGELRAFVDSLRVSTEYVTCLVRFGRVFSGLGLLVLGLGLLKWKLFAPWVGAAAAAIGGAAMAVTMAFPDHLALYAPVFHVEALWLAAVGVVVLLGGLRLNTVHQTCT